VAISGPVTISNCGGSDADNVCGAGTMTKTEAGGWNNRVWDDRPCCWDCECTGARWKVVADNTFCGFSAWSAAGSTNKDGDQKMASYFLQWHAGNLKAGQGGPDDGWSDTVLQSGLTFAADIAGKFLEVHLTQTGADLVLDGATVHSIASAPADSQYRFGCASYNNGAGYTDLAYYTGREPYRYDHYEKGAAPSDGGAAAATHQAVCAATAGTARRAAGQPYASTVARGAGWHGHSASAASLPCACVHGHVFVWQVLVCMGPLHWHASARMALRHVAESGFGGA
jgi:hypothetical protein